MCSEIKTQEDNMKSKTILSNNRTTLKSFIMVLALLMCILGPASFQAKGQSLAADKIPGSFSELVKKASPGVVNVSTVTKVNGQQIVSPFGNSDQFNEFFNYLNQDQQQKTYKQKGMGTGFIIDREGYILTNNHVVEGADEITVTLSDEKKYKAKVIGLDSATDLALIKIEGAKDLSPLTMGDSDQIEVGDWVIAIGNPFGLDRTVTAGIVSAKERRNSELNTTYQNYIQTDASINQGNSGGPLMDTNGEVIGINSAIIASQSGGSVGIGFAIPINMAKELLPQLKKGKIVRGYMGVTPQSITDDLKASLKLKDTKGALVGDVAEGGPADKAGLKVEDVITSFDGKEIKDDNELRLVVSATAVGKSVKVEALRNGEKKTFDLKVAERPDTADTSSQSTYGGNEKSPDLGFRAGAITNDMARQYNLTDRSGVIILQVDEGSVAEEAGLAAGDIILEIDREKITDINQFTRKIRSYKSGDTILMRVKRSGTAVFLTLKVE
jgi:serine protease Do